MRGLLEWQILSPLMLLFVPCIITEIPPRGLGEGFSCCRVTAKCGAAARACAAEHGPGTPPILAKIGVVGHPLRLRGGEVGEPEEAEGGLGLGSLLTEPDDFFRHETRGQIEHKREGGKGSVRLQTGTRHSLWGHLLWNAGKCLADHLDTNAADLCKGKSVLELGAGLGLPSIMCALNGARVVVSTDWPEKSLLAVLQENVDRNVEEGGRSRIKVAGYKWGADPSIVLQHSPEGFDLIVLSDLVFNHIAHRSLLDSCKKMLHKRGVILVSFSHHRPRLADKDLAFFSQARSEFGFRAELAHEWHTSAMRLPNDQLRAYAETGASSGGGEQNGPPCSAAADKGPPSRMGGEGEEEEGSRTVFLYRMDLHTDDTA